MEDLEPDSIKIDKEPIDTAESESEIRTYSVWLERKSFRIALVSIFTALAVVLGYALAPLLNIELFTLTLFLSGFILGKRDGMIVGISSSFIFCFFNFFGSDLLLLAFQLIYYTSVGLLGALTHQLLRRKKFFTPDKDLYNIQVMVIFGILSGLMTFVYDIISTLVFAISISGTIDSFLPTLIIGIPSSIIHIVGNTLGFIFILPGFIQLVYKMLY